MTEREIVTDAVASRPRAHTLHSGLRATDVVIAREQPDRPEVIELLGEGLAYLRARFSEDECFTLDLEGLRRPGVTFLLARLAGEPVGCGALVAEDGFVEIKRMYVSERARGLGLGRKILEALLALAVSRGDTIVRLETGVGLDAAIGLYSSVGFERIEGFGEYTTSKASICMEKRLG